MKEKGLQVDCLVDLKGVPELCGVEAVGGKGLRIGALTTLHEIETSAQVIRDCPALGYAAGCVGSLQVRNRGTIGGNLANASPAADTAPMLLALDAEVELMSVRGSRVLPIDSFFRGPGETALGPAELLARIIVPLQPPGTRAQYLKLGPRRAMDIAVVGVAVSLTMQDGICERARVALGAVGPTPLRARSAEAVLTGKTVDDALAIQAAEAAVADCSPIDDVRASAWYRREMVRVLVRRAIRLALGNGEAAA